MKSFLLLAMLLNVAVAKAPFDMGWRSGISTGSMQLTRLDESAMR